jgi:hypothetical protein
MYAMPLSETSGDRKRVYSCEYDSGRDSGNEIPRRTCDTSRVAPSE